MANLNLVSEQKIQRAILFLRGKKIVLDTDLADFYRVPTKVFNQAVKRNIDRFPQEFMFQLNKVEKEDAISNFEHLRKLKYSSYLPYAFTEHGVVMAANVLNSSIAVQASIQVVKVFIRMTEVLAVHKELSSKIEKLERKLGSKLSKHDNELKILFEAIIAFA